MKRLIAGIMAFILLLSLAACDKQPTDPTVKPTTDTTTVSPTKPAIQTTDGKKDSLTMFREEMPDVVMAVADFGFPELSEEFEIMDYLLDEFPVWMQNHAFIGNIPQEQIVRTCGYEAWGNLLCVVPQDPQATISVTITWEDGREEVAYRKETGEPILLLADISEESSVCISVVDNKGAIAYYTPYWEYLDGAEISQLIMDFSPISEKTAYDNALDYGWTAPDDSFLKNHFWYSDYGYQLELSYDPGQMYDGDAWIYEDDRSGATYQGTWRYADGILHLNMKNNQDSTLVIQGDFPILSNPFGEEWLGIFRTADGKGLPRFYDDMEYDDLIPIAGDEMDAYEYALSQGWRLPELSELTDTFWLSYNYGIDLLEDAVPGDNGGDAVIYDVDEDGVFTKSYTGSWQYEDGMLHLFLTPEFSDGYMVDDSFPVLMLDGELWIGRNENGIGLPHFYGDQLMDVLVQPKG